MSEVRALVISGFGINCEKETAAAYRLCGAEAGIVHLNELFNGTVRLADYDLLNFCGGFSFGDDLGSGKVLANKIHFRKTRAGGLLFDEIRLFLDSGKFILGICNGFQMLVKMGLLPNLSENFEQEVTLTHNESGRFEDRWCRIAVIPENPSRFLNGMQALDLPVRHGEGRLLVRDGKILEAIRSKKLGCLYYADEQGKPARQYPDNPNGSLDSLAGLTDVTGRILGLMPHPEAFLTFYQHPDWNRKKYLQKTHSDEGDGLVLFRNIIRAAREGK